MDPVAVLSLYDTLCAKNHSEGIILGECFKNALNFLYGKFLSGFTAEAREYLVGVVMVMIMTVASTLTMLVVVMVVMVLVVVASALTVFVVIVVVMLVTVASALTVLIVIVVVMLVVVASALTVLIVIVVVMLVVVASALTVLVVVVVVMLVVVASALTVLIVVVVVMIMTVASALAMLIVIVVVMLVTVASALAMLVVVVVMMLVTVASALAMLVVVVVMMLMMLVLFLKLVKSVLEGVLLLHSGKNILAVKLVPRSGYDSRGSVVLSDKLNGCLDLLRLGKVGMRKNDGGSIGNLVVIELAKILHIHLTLINVCNGGEAIELGIFSFHRLNSLDNVGKLTYSAGLDDNAVGVELVKHLNKRLGEITDERAADAAGIHLCNFDTGILKEASVNTDLTEFVFYKHKLLGAVCLFDKLLYKSGLTCSEEA